MELVQARDIRPVVNRKLARLMGRYTEIPRLAVRYLWFNAYYGGPSEGILEYQGYKCWYEFVDELGSERILLVKEIAPEQLAFEEYWHGQFRLYVGFHADCEVATQGLIHPQSRWHLFYQEYKKQSKPDYTDNRVVGWFRD